MTPGHSSAEPVTPGDPASQLRQVHAYAFGPFRLLPTERILRRGDQVLPLPPKAFDTLLALVRHAGHLILKGDLMKTLWPDSFVEEVNLANNISLLRKVLGDNAADCRYIQTVPKLGYRFLPAVTGIWKGGAADAAPAVEEERAQRPTRFMALPFRLLHADPALEFLGRSIPEAISASLAGLRSITVRSSLLAARLAEGQPDPRRIAQEADIDVLLTGSILADGSQLRVAAELIQAPTGTLVASCVLQTGRESVFEIQDSLVRRIVEVLMLRLTRSEQSALDHDVPASARAFEFYLRANYVQRQRSVENLVLARDLYRECLAEDPNFAAAWARLGRCYRFLDKFGDEGTHHLELAREAFRRAFSLSPGLSLAHHLFTPLEADLGRAQAAMVRLLRHAATHPHDPELFAGLVQSCRFCGLLEESLAAHDCARRLDPNAVTSVPHTFFVQADYPRALASYDTAAGYYLDAAVLAATAREAEAAALLARRQISPAPDAAFRTPGAALAPALALSLAGDHAGSLALVRRVLAQPARDPEGKFYLARHLAWEGAAPEALANIANLIEEGFCCSAALLRDPWLQPLSGLPGYRDVLDALLRRETEARAAFLAADGERILA